MDSKFRGLENVEVAGEALQHDQLAYLVTAKASGGWDVDVWHSDVSFAVSLVRIHVSATGYYSLCSLGRPVFAETGPSQDCMGRAGGLLVPDQLSQPGGYAISDPHGFLYPQKPETDRLMRLICLEEDRLRLARYEKRALEQSLRTVFSGLGKGAKEE